MLVSLYGWLYTRGVETCNTVILLMSREKVLAKELSGEYARLVRVDT